MDFIRTQLIKKIKEQVKEKVGILKYDGHFFLDNPIPDGKQIINRVSSTALYSKNEILPSNWYNVKGTTLLEEFSQLKDNDCYIYKIYEGKSHKMRIKKKR